MTINRWTLALASAGLISLPAVAAAEEQPTPLLTGLSSTIISGYVDTSAQWNIGSGNANTPPYSFGGTDKADGFNLNAMKLAIEKPLDPKDEWAAGYKTELLFGPDADFLATTSSGTSTSDFCIKQAYVAVHAPVGNGLDFKIGVWDTVIGYEVTDASSNPNFTRSYGYSIEPTTHTGIQAAYQVSEACTLVAGVADTWTPTINDRPFAPVNDPNNDQPYQAESYKAYMGSITLTAPDSWGFLAGSSLYAGIVNGFGDVSVPYTATDAVILTSYYAGATVATPITGLRAGAAFDLLDIQKVKNRTYAIAGYLSYQATEKLSFHGRVDYFRDNLDDLQTGWLYRPTGGLGRPDEAEVLALTGTIQYDLWKNVLSRLEIRWDRSLHGNDLYGGSSPGGDANQKDAVMVALNLTYKF